MLEIYAEDGKVVFCQRHGDSRQTIKFTPNFVRIVIQYLSEAAEEAKSQEAKAGGA